MVFPGAFSKYAYSRSSKCLPMANLACIRVRPSLLPTHLRWSPPFSDRTLPPMFACAGVPEFSYPRALCEQWRVSRAISAGVCPSSSNGSGRFLCSSALTSPQSPLGTLFAETRSRKRERVSCSCVKIARRGSGRLQPPSLISSTLRRWRKPRQPMPASLSASREQI